MELSSLLNWGEIKEDLLEGDPTSVEISIIPC